MDPNTHSISVPGGLDRLAAVVEELAAEDLAGMTDAEAAQRVLVLRGLIERLEGHWLRELAGVDGRGAAGADQGVPAESTAGCATAPAWAGPTPTSGSGSPERCTAGRWQAPPRRWRMGRSATRTLPR
jgi:hypothetical protein